MARKRRKRNPSRSPADASVADPLPTSSATEVPANGAEKDDQRDQSGKSSGQARQTRPAGRQPVAETPTSEKPASEKPASETPAADAPVTETSAAEEPAAKKRTARTLAEAKPPREEKGSTVKPEIAETQIAPQIADHRLVTMLEIVNQLLAEQHESPRGHGVAKAPVHPEIAEQLRRRAVELDRRDAACQARLQALHAQEEVWVQRDESLRLREQDWVRQSTELAAKRRDLARRLRHHRRSQHAEQTFLDQTTQLSALVEGIAESVRQESSQVRDVLLETVTAIQESTTQSRSPEADWHQQLASKEDEIAALQEQLEQNREQLEQTAGELQSLREESAEQAGGGFFSASDADLESLARQVESLQMELKAANERAEELQSQNGDLAGQVANSQVNNRLTNQGTQSLESLPWEERKRLILARLEDEESNFAADTQPSDDPAAAEVRDELQSLRDLVHQTDREIMRRDAEIAELRQLLDQQSNTVGEVAIGAAAIAGMFDQDELIREERSKLQEIQTEWQEKLREAEIEVSLERAKLARERQELEKRNAELEEMLAHQERANSQPSPDGDGKPARRWLARMGLSEE